MNSNINKIKNWVAKKSGSVTLALSNVEKNSLNQTGETLATDINHSQRHTQGQIADSLINGEVTQEVMDLRWRMYKILQESDGLSSEIVGYEPDGTPITKTIKKNKLDLKKIKTDKYDNYDLECVIYNDSIVASGNEIMDNDYITLFDKSVINYDEKGEITSATHGEINGESYYFTSKSEKPIKIFSNYTRRFYLENYTKKLNIKHISDEEKLLEFYVSMYPDEYNRTSRLFLSELKKIISDNRKSDITYIDIVEFITYKALGVSDFLKFKYEITSFDKIIEFNGDYVIKFKAKPLINGENIVEKYKQNELDLKYNDKVKK